MPLVPSTKDPNRKRELQRMRDDPQAFGPDVIKPKPSDWTPSRLPADQPNPTPNQTPNEVANTKTTRGRR